MIRRKAQKQDVQKKVYHTDRFYQPITTPKIETINSNYKEVLESLQKEVSILNSYVEINQAVFYVPKEDVCRALIGLSLWIFICPVVRLDQRLCSML